MHCVPQSIPTISFDQLRVESRPLASGSFKSVYKAVWARDKQQVAVLVLRQGASAASEINMFERLGRHPHLVKLLAVCARPPAGDMCMVLEFAQRGSLDGVLQQLSDEGESGTHGVLLTAAGQVCIYVCMYVSICHMCVCVCVCACVFLECARARSVCSFCVSLNVEGERECVCIYMCVCVCVCMYVYIYIYIYIYIRTYTHTHCCMLHKSRVRTCLRAATSFTMIQARTGVWANGGSDAHTTTLPHTHTHTHTHTHVCTLQVCEAMEILMQYSIIHRDLAARNVLCFSFHPKIRTHVLVKVKNWAL